jgi:hypothetical protein
MQTPLALADSIWRGIQNSKVLQAFMLFFGVYSFEVLAVLLC